MQLNTTLFSVDTLHVQVPASIPSEDFNERVANYSLGNEYNGVDDEDGGLEVSATDMKFNISGYDNQPLKEFFAAVCEALGDADRVYFYR